MDPESNESTTAEQKPKRGVSRLQFLRRSSAALAALGVTGAVAGCDTAQPPAIVQQLPIDDVDSMAEKYNDVPAPPTSIPAPELRVFTADEAAMVDALTARIIPGDASDPGAHEAGVLYYIDGKLSWNEGNTQPTYTKPPYAQLYTGSSPPPTSSSHGFKVIWVKESEIVRYGAQSSHSPKETYRMSLPLIDSYAQKHFGHKFADLSNTQQDTVITQLANGSIPGFKNQHDCKSFFAMLRSDTIEGMFSDPLYGGNRNLVGWKLIGYPGIHRAYTPAEMHDERLTSRIPRQSMIDLMPEYPGQPSPPHSGILPESGSNYQSKT